MRYKIAGTPLRNLSKDKKKKTRKICRSIKEGESYRWMEIGAPGGGWVGGGVGGG